MYVMTRGPDSELRLVLADYQRERRGRTILIVAIPDEILECSTIIPSKANNYGKSLLSKMIFAAYRLVQ